MGQVKAEKLLLWLLMFWIETLINYSGGKECTRKLVTPKPTLIIIRKQVKFSRKLHFADWKLEKRLQKFVALMKFH